MKHKEILTKLAVMGLSVSMVCSTPVLTAYATEQTQVTSETTQTTEVDFVIDTNGVLTKYNGKDTVVEIPVGITGIGDYAFSGCTSLISIELPESVTSIGDGAFSGCDNLTTIEIPESVTSIGGSAFERTPWLEKKQQESPLVIINSILVDGKKATGDIVVPDGVTSIGDGAFSECEGLTSIKLPEGIMNIGNSVFSKCYGLKSIEIPESVTSIGKWAFGYCMNLENINIPESVTSIGDYAFAYCYALRNIEFSKSMTNIAKSTFYKCKSLTNIKIPSNIKSIGGHAFYNCENLKQVIISEGVITIHERAFDWCGSLEKIVIPASVTSIGESVFREPITVTIYGYENSYAQIYANENNIPFKVLESTEAPQENPFSDVPESEYYYNPVLWALESGITSGLNEHQFAPEMACTRGQVVTFLWRAMGKPEPTTTKNPFVDVNSNEYYYKAVLWALENGITAGMDSTHFAPDVTVTRSQFVTFLHRAEGKPSYSVANPFSDVQKDYYYDAILWAYENKVTSGLNATTFGTEEACTRGQVVTFLYRALK